VNLCGAPRLGDGPAQHHGIQLTSAVISAAYNYRNGVKNAPQEAVKIIDDLTGLLQILEKLLKFD
jgi:hypothetical protein